MNEAEVLIVGAGPAGLTAATYLARFRRRVRVANGGEDGRLFVDAHQATSVKGLYAAGDVVRGLNQIAVAGAEAAVAATAIHNALREADGWTVRG